MALSIPAVLLGTSPNFTGIGELQSGNTLAGVFNHVDIGSNSLAGKVGTAAASLSVGTNSMVGRLATGDLAALNAGQIAQLLETALDRNGAGFSTTGQFMAYEAGTGFVAVSPGADGEALVFNSTQLGGISASAVASELSGLSDVTVSAPSAGDVVIYGGTEFTNVRLESDLLSDVDTTTVAPTTNDVLTWNGTNFVPTAPATSPFTVGDDFGGAPIPNAGDITLAVSADLTFSGGGELSENSGKLTLSSAATNVVVDSGLEITSLPSLSTPTNVLTSNSGTVSVSSLAELANEIGFEDLKDTPVMGTAEQVLRVALTGSELEFTTPLKTNLTGSAYLSGRSLRSNGVAYADVPAVTIIAPTVNSTGTMWAWNNVLEMAVEIPEGAEGQYLAAGITGTVPAWVDPTLDALTNVTLNTAAEGDILLRDATDFKNVQFSTEADKYVLTAANATRAARVLGVNGADSVDWDYKTYVSGGGASGWFRAGTSTISQSVTLEYPDARVNFWTVEIITGDTIVFGSTFVGGHVVKMTAQHKNLPGGLTSPPTTFVRSYVPAVGWSRWHREGERQPVALEGTGNTDLTASNLAHSHDGVYVMSTTRGYIHNDTYVEDLRYTIFYNSVDEHFIVWSSDASHWHAMDSTAGDPISWVPGQPVNSSPESTLTTNSETWGELLRPDSASPNVTYTA